MPARNPGPKWSAGNAGEAQMENLSERIIENARSRYFGVRRMQEPQLHDDP